MELELVRREGKRVRTEHLDVRVVASLSALQAVAPPGGSSRPAAGGLGRVGIVVPKHRQTAVRRNQLKRRLRELVRLRLLPGLVEGAVVIRARAEAYGASFAELARQIERVRREAERLVRAAAAAPAASAVPSAAPALAPAPPTEGGLRSAGGAAGGAAGGNSAGGGAEGASPPPSPNDPG